MSGKKQLPPSVNRSSGDAKQKTVPVAEGSMQSRAPGAAQKGNEQVDVKADLKKQVQVAPPGNLQNESGGSTQTARAEPGTQQGGWSSRQQAQRTQARGEEDRQAAPRQSGYGGSEQYQHAGSQESPSGPPGSQQTGRGGQPQNNPDEKPADMGSKPAHPGPSRR